MSVGPSPVLRGRAAVHRELDGTSYAEEVLVTKSELEEKKQRMSELETQASKLLSMPPSSESFWLASVAWSGMTVDWLRTKGVR